VWPPRDLPPQCGHMCIQCPNPNPKLPSKLRNKQVCVLHIIDSGQIKSIQFSSVKSSQVTARCGAVRRAVPGRAGPGRAEAEAEISPAFLLSSHGGTFFLVPKVA
jgi:hypothetical protein